MDAPDRMYTVESLPRAVLPADDPHFIRDPYPWLAELRSQAPAFFDPQRGEVFFTRHEELSTLLRDRRLGRARPDGMPEDALPLDDPALERAWESIRNFEDNRFFEMEPPEHTRLRRLVSSAFTPQRVQALRPRIAALAEELLAQVRPQGRMEFVQAFAGPLPVIVIAELLGVPPGERDRLRPWSAEIVKMYELEYAPEQVLRSAAAVDEFSDYLRGMYRRRLQEPQDDLLTALAFASQDGERLTEDELVASAIFLLNAGHEATVNALSLGLAALLENHVPAEQAEAAGWGAVADELLRYDTPLPLFHRWVYQEDVYGGVQLHAGDRVGMLLISGNRDPLRFSHPDALDFSRPENPHLTFGLGVHYCLGAPLARQELQAAYSALFTSLPRLRFASPPSFRPGFVIRGIQEMQLVWG